MNRLPLLKALSLPLSSRNKNCYYQGPVTDHLDIATLGHLWQQHRPRFIAPFSNKDHQRLSAT